MNFSSRIVEAMTDDELATVQRYLREHNQTANPLWWSKFVDPQHDDRPLQIVALNARNECVGGLLATSSMKWLKVNIMAVRPDVRRSGVGSMLLSAAENEGKHRGCEYAFLDTMQFQAPDFYRKCGYQVAGSIPDWDSHGNTKFFFTKQL
tara:strand:+ start:105030 stop:105479 length:450 start_codon:yes stop_codon:yes gene_type:complete